MFDFMDGVIGDYEIIGVLSFYVVYVVSIMSAALWGRCI